MNKEQDENNNENNIVMKNELEKFKGDEEKYDRDKQKDNVGERNIATKPDRDSYKDNKYRNTPENDSSSSKNIFKIISLSIWGISLIVSLSLIFFVKKLNVLPLKYFLGIILAISIIEVATLIIFLVKKKGKILRTIIDLILVLVIIAELFVSMKINKVQAFVKSNIENNYETNYYSIIVSASSKLNTLEDLAGKDVHYCSSEDDEDKQELVNKINSTISNANLIEETDKISSMTSVTKNDNYILVISSSMIDFMNSFDSTYETKIKTITTFELKTLKNETSVTTNTDITKEPFYIYFSGIDTRSGGLPSTCLSDSNIIVAVNPNTKKILLVHIPRDYFVLVHGTTGQKDKFTHAGLRGGIELSKATLEDIFDMKFPYYVRANFNSVSNLVDAIGGINIYNDLGHTIKTNYKGYQFKAGWNYNVKGERALAFAHERYSYKEGDRHRGENQEQVITRIVEKMSSSSELLRNFDDIMKAMDGTFETNITYEQISSFIKMQLNDMAKWDIETYNVNGSDGMEYTASFPTQKSYVMYPDYSTVNEAKNKISEVLGNN